jgi:hypothetical protein
MGFWIPSVEHDFWVEPFVGGFVYHERWNVDDGWLWKLWSELPSFEDIGGMPTETILDAMPTKFPYMIPEGSELETATGLPFILDADAYIHSLSIGNGDGIDDYVMVCGGTATYLYQEEANPAIDEGLDGHPLNPCSYGGGFSTFHAAYGWPPIDMTDYPRRWRTIGSTAGQSPDFFAIANPYWCQYLRPNTEYARGTVIKGIQGGLRVPNDNGEFNEWESVEGVTPWTCLYNSLLSHGLTARNRTNWVVWWVEVWVNELKDEGEEHPPAFWLPKYDESYAGGMPYLGLLPFLSMSITAPGIRLIGGEEDEN